MYEHEPVPQPATRFAKPHCNASSLLTDLPVKIRSIALESPTMACNLLIPTSDMEVPI